MHKAVVWQLNSLDGFENSTINTIFFKCWKKTWMPKQKKRSPTEKKTEDLKLSGLGFLFTLLLGLFLIKRQMLFF